MSPAVSDSISRPAEPGELCPCGRPAVRVINTDPPQGWCGMDNGGGPVDGWCPFCQNELRHDRPRVDPTDGVTPAGVFPQGEPCPRYRLRLTDRAS